MELACQCPVVVCCRCSPQQKADIVKLLKKHTGKRTCAIGEMSRSSSRSPSLSACPSASVRIWCTMHLVRILRKFEIFYFFFATILLLFHIWLREGTIQPTNYRTPSLRERFLYYSLADERCDIFVWLYAMVEMTSVWFRQRMLEWGSREK